MSDKGAESGASFKGKNESSKRRRQKQRKEKKKRKGYPGNRMVINSQKRKPTEYQSINNLKGDSKGDKEEFDKSKKKENADSMIVTDHIEGKKGLGSDLTKNTDLVEAATVLSETALNDAISEMSEVNYKESLTEAAMVLSETVMNEAISEITEANYKESLTEVAMVLSETALNEAISEITEANYKESLTEVAMVLSETALDEAISEITEANYKESLTETATVLSETALNDAISEMSEVNYKESLTETATVLSETALNDAISEMSEANYKESLTEVAMVLSETALNEAISEITEANYKESLTEAVMVLSETAMDDAISEMSEANYKESLTEAAMVLSETVMDDAISEMSEANYKESLTEVAMVLSEMALNDAISEISEATYKESLTEVAMVLSEMALNDAISEISEATYKESLTEVAMVLSITALNDALFEISSTKADYQTQESGDIRRTEKLSDMSMEISKTSLAEAAKELKLHSPPFVKAELYVKKLSIDENKSNYMEQAQSVSSTYGSGESKDCKTKQKTNLKENVDTKPDEEQTDFDPTVSTLYRGTLLEMRSRLSKDDVCDKDDAVVSLNEFVDAQLETNGQDVDTNIQDTEGKVNVKDFVTVTDTGRSAVIQAENLQNMNESRSLKDVDISNVDDVSVKASSVASATSEDITGSVESVLCDHKQESGYNNEARQVEEMSLSEADTVDESLLEHVMLQSDADVSDSATNISTEVYDSIPCDDSFGIMSIFLNSEIHHTGYRTMAQNEIQEKENHCYLYFSLSDFIRY